jgi:hypothetical protein
MQNNKDKTLNSQAIYSATWDYLGKEVRSQKNQFVALNHIGKKQAETHKKEENLP